MARKNKVCSTCGSKYAYCPTCNSADKLAPTWKSEFCTETCKDIWQIATEFNLGIISQEDAQVMLGALDLKPTEEYKEMIQNDINNIRHEVVEEED